MPASIWLPGLTNPQALLTAIMQTTARRNDCPLDKTTILTEITKRQPHQVDTPAKDGVYIHG
jgi:dynein heavy chain, axonemal